MRRWVGALAAVLGQTLFVSGFVPPLAPGGDRVAMQARLVCSARMEAPSVRRREALLSIGIGLATTIVSQPSSATPVRAPLPPGPADPADWATLTKAAGTAAAWGEDLEDPASWQGIAEQVKKAPFTQESMDLMFRKAAKNLPANALLGSDAGYWAGVRVEVIVCVRARKLDENVQSHAYQHAHHVAMHVCMFAHTSTHAHSDAGNGSDGCVCSGGVVPE